MICLLDDNLDDLDFIKSKLDSKGIKNYRMFSTEDEFLVGINDKTIIVVLDHQLGTGHTGLDIMKKVLVRYPVCYAIVVSGNMDGNVIMSYMNNDAFRYVDKNDKAWIDNIVIHIQEAQARVQLVIDFAKKNLI